MAFTESLSVEFLTKSKIFYQLKKIFNYIYSSQFTAQETVLAINGGSCGLDKRGTLGYFSPRFSYTL